MKQALGCINWGFFMAGRNGCFTHFICLHRN